MPSVISGDANVSATEFGYLDGVTSGLQSQIDSKLNLAGGKILQIVRATDTTTRTTTSTSFVDVTGLSVSITPQTNTSAVILIAAFDAQMTRFSAGNNSTAFQITDSSNNAISGAESGAFRIDAILFSQMFCTLIAYATPATTSSVTYKVRFKSPTGTTLAVDGAGLTSQLYAIEVSA